MMESSAEDQYDITRDCFNCGHRQVALVSRREAVFQLVDRDKVFGATCPKCGSDRFGGSREIPDMNAELWEEWCTDEELYICDQDEDLYLNDQNYLDQILYYVDAPQTVESKRILLMQVVCLMAYDEVRINRGPVIGSRVISEINQLVRSSGQHRERILSYLHHSVRPYLSIPPA